MNKPRSSTKFITMLTVLFTIRYKGGIRMSNPAYSWQALYRIWSSSMPVSIIRLVGDTSIFDTVISSVVSSLLVSNSCSLFSTCCL